MGDYLSLLSNPAVFWLVVFLAVMYATYTYLARLKNLRERRALSLQNKLVGYPVGVVFMAANILVLNLVIASIIFADPARWDEEEFTFSQRLRRYYRQRTTTIIERWQTWVALRIAPLLDRHLDGHISGGD